MFVKIIRLLINMLSKWEGMMWISYVVIGVVMILLSMRENI